MAIAEVVTLYDTNANHLTDMMHKCAERIDAETDEDDRTVAVIAIRVTKSDDIELFGWGATSDFHCLGVLAMASARLAIGPDE